MAAPEGTYASRLPLILGQKGAPFVDITAAVDPRIGFGYPAPVGSHLRNSTTGLLYEKMGASDTAWKGVGISLLNASPTGTIDLYVDSEGGVDTNDGLTALTPKATIAALRAAYWYQAAQRQRVVVHLAGGVGIAAIQTYIEDCLWIGGGEEASAAGWRYEGPEMNLIFPTSGPATAALDVVPAVRVDQANVASGTGNRTRLDFTVAAPGWTVNDLVGSFVRVTRAGNKVFYELPITENAADSLTVDTLGIVGVLLAADTVEIVRPAVVIVGTAADPNYEVTTLAGKGCGYSINGLGTNHAVFKRLTLTKIFSTVHGVSYDRCLFMGSLVTNSGSSLVALMTGLVNCAAWSSMMLGGGAALVTSYDAVPPISAVASVSLCVAKPAGWVPVPIVRVGSDVATNNGFHCVWICYLPMSVYDSASAAGTGAITVDAGSHFTMYTGIALGGNRNTRLGIRARRGSRVRINGGVLATITGLAGDLQVETGAAIAYGAGVGAFEEVLGYNGNFTRMLEGVALAPTGDTSMITTLAL